MNEMSDKAQRCYKHYCRVCRAVEFIPAGTTATPRCCGKHMAFLGHEEAVPGRVEAPKKINAK